MPIPSSSPSKAKLVSKKRPPSSDNGGQPQPKRTKSPGVRLIHGRIYDSDNGKTCHQCRQKTMDFSASCKNSKGNKSCTLNMCHKCLSNRYGEKAEEVDLLDDWKCPKCRGICNCSFCMKKMGHQPTGLLIHTAKANGHSSVSEFIQRKGVDNLEMYKVAASPKKLLSPKKPADINKEAKVVPRSKLRKENSFDASADASLNNACSTITSVGKKIKKSKREGLKEINKGGDGGCPESSPKRPKVVENGLKMKDDALSRKENSKKAVSDKVSPSPIKSDNEKKKKKKKDSGKNQEAVVINSSKEDNAPAKIKVKPQEVKKCAASLDHVAIEVDFPLPKGSVLTTVWGIELSHEDIGLALQFLEFCAAFGKVFDIKKTQGHSILRELQRGRCGSRGVYSSAVRFHIQLISIIQEDIGEESPCLSRKKSWLQALEKCISESDCLPTELSSLALGGAVEKYDALAFSRKLKILNFLCDEALCTEKLRIWIDDENSKIAEKEKESRDKIAATRNKEKLLKQKLQDDIAQAIIEKNGAPLSISEHEDIVLQIKTEVAKIQDEIVGAKLHSTKRKQKSVAVRSEPCLLDADGRVFWKLGCCGGENEILLQDMGSWDADTVAEKWFIYGTEQKQEIDKYISSIRVKRSRIQKASPVSNVRI